MAPTGPLKGPLTDNLPSSSANLEQIDRCACSKQSSLKEQVALNRARVAELISENDFGPYQFASSFVPKVVEGSRYRAKFAVGGTISDPLIGFPRSDGSVVDHADCPLHHPLINQCARLVRGLTSEFKLTPYEVSSGKGELKGLAVRVNSTGDQAVLRFILRSTEAVTRLRKALPKLQEVIPAIRVVSANLQSLPAALPEGPEEIVLTDLQYIDERFCGVAFRAGARTFSQVTPETAEALYAEASKIAEGGPARAMLDLFCGIGVFSILSHRNLQRGTGVEINAESIESAKFSAKLNEITNLSFVAEDAGKFLQGIEPGTYDTILCNPPRRGCGASLIQRIIELSPERIIISSCSPETLAADLRLLNGQFKLESLQPFEMFPLTEHVEVLALLGRR